MNISENEKASVEALLFNLNRHKKGTITVDFNNNPYIGGVKYDREITEDIRNVLTKVIKEQNAKQ